MDNIENVEEINSSSSLSSLQQENKASVESFLELEGNVRKKKEDTINKRNIRKIVNHQI
jgi:hypothetical protein